MYFNKKNCKSQIIKTNSSTLFFYVINSNIKLNLSHIHQRNRIFKTKKNY